MRWDSFDRKTTKSKVAVFIIAINNAPLLYVSKALRQFMDICFWSTFLWGKFPPGDSTFCDLLFFIHAGKSLLALGKWNALHWDVGEGWGNCHGPCPPSHLFQRLGMGCQLIKSETSFPRPMRVVTLFNKPTSFSKMVLYKDLFAFFRIYNHCDEVQRVYFSDPVQCLHLPLIS